MYCDYYYCQMSIEFLFRKKSWYFYNLWSILCRSSLLNDINFISVINFVCMINEPANFFFTVYTKFIMLWKHQFSMDVIGSDVHDVIHLKYNVIILSSKNFVLKSPCMKGGFALGQNFSLCFQLTCFSNTDDWWHCVIHIMFQLHRNVNNDDEPFFPPLGESQNAFK